MADTQKQHKRQYDWLKAYQFTKGKSGNPGGMKKGTKSLKRFAREFLESLPEEEKIKYLASLPPEIVWRMAEGNPQNDLKLGGIEDAQPILVKFLGDDEPNSGDPQGV